MYTQISVEMITKQKLTELRNEAEMYKLLEQARAGERVGLAARLFSWMFRKSGLPQADRQIKGERAARLESSGHVP